MPDYTVSTAVATASGQFGPYTVTADATPVAAATVQTQSNKVYLITAKVVGATIPTLTTNQAGYVRYGVFKNIAGTLALVGSVTATATIETNSAWDCTLDASGTTIRVMVTGAAGVDIAWHTQVDIIELQKYAVAFGPY